MRVRGEAIAHQNDTRLRPRACRRCDRCFPRLRPYPHPPLRGTFSRREKGSAWRLEPLSPRERGWDEGAGRSHRASERHQASPAPLPAAAIDISPGFARTLIRPFGAPSPDGRRGARGAWSPSPRRERGWGEGGRSHRASDDTRLRPRACPPLRSMFFQASPVPSSAPSGHLLPMGEGSVPRWNSGGAVLCKVRSGLTAAQSSRVLFPQPATASTRSDAFLPTMGARPVFRSGNESVSPPSP